MPSLRSYGERYANFALDIGENDRAMSQPLPIYRTYCPVYGEGLFPTGRARYHPGAERSPLLEEKCVPKGPRGERRPSGVVECAVMVAKIATGEIEERGLPRDGYAAEKLAPRLAPRVCQQKSDRPSPSKRRWPDGDRERE